MGIHCGGDTGAHGGGGVAALMGGCASGSGASSSTLECAHGGWIQPDIWRIMEALLGDVCG
jgi:hypothetical protein